MNKKLDEREIASYEHSLMLVDNELKVSRRGVKHLEGIKKRIQRRLKRGGKNGKRPKD